MKIDAQNRLIRAYLEAGNSITQIDALNIFGCFRLAAVIYNLKKEGMKIKSTSVEMNGKRFAKYVKQ